ncbi:hypothetical protein IC744_15395 [Microbacterium hominis]|uniref:hypothetical protein n=2 Tax=Microbacteriaceae TaxID=85023 RepID=UPI00168BB17E|nr:hypothetical protein [Microbacterium hominis]QOC28714.1 hypothetical protein IC744_15395 [Microbacterium hominis]
MIVVLEGPDFAGKSTAAEALARQFGGSIVANGPPPPDVILRDHYLDQVYAATAAGRLIVFDRLHVGELIYGPIYRGASRLSDDNVMSIEYALNAIDALKVHVDASDDVLLERLHGPRGDDMVHHDEQLMRIAHQYRELLAADGLLPGWKSISTGDIASVIAREIQRWKMIRDSPERG